MSEYKCHWQDGRKVHCEMLWTVYEDSEVVDRFIFCPFCGAKNGPLVSDKIDISLDHSKDMLLGAGWMYAALCMKIDEGVDIRTVEVPALLSEMENSFKEALAKADGG